MNRERMILAGLAVGLVVYGPGAPPCHASGLPGGSTFEWGILFGAYFSFWISGGLALVCSIIGGLAAGKTGIGMGLQAAAGLALVGEVGVALSLFGANRAADLEGILGFLLPALGIAAVLASVGTALRSRHRLPSRSE